MSESSTNFPRSLGYEQITSLSSAVNVGSVISGGIPEGTCYAIIRAETQNVRWRDDGTSPTASVGMPLNVGESMNYTGQFSRLKFIEVTASAKLNITYYGE